MEVLKSFIEQVKLDKVVVSECQILIKNFGLAMTVFTKFEEIWKKIGIKDKSLNKDCALKIRNLAWIMFIIAKGNNAANHWV